MKQYVIVHMNNGPVKIWPDYGTAWGSPIYTVIGYADNYKAAQALAREYRTQAAQIAKERVLALQSFDAEFLTE